MKKIIHMSDLHIGAPEPQLIVPFEIVVERLCARIANPEEHVVVITGDLVDNAGDQENYVRAKTQLDRLKREGFKHILVVPGNHDYKEGNHSHQKFVEAFKWCFFEKELEYPKKDIIDDVAFIGLDSMAEEINWYDKHHGEGHVGKDQRDRLWDLLESAEIKSCARRVVYLHHHPIDEIPLLRLKDAATLMEGMAGKVDAVLYGHHHMGKNFNKPEYEIPRCYDAGCVTLKHGGWWHKVPGLKVFDATRVIRLETDPSNDERLNLSPDQSQ